MGKSCGSRDVEVENPTPTMRVHPITSHQVKEIFLPLLILPAYLHVCLLFILAPGPQSSVYLGIHLVSSHTRDGSLDHSGKEG